MDNGRKRGRSAGFSLWAHPVKHLYGGVLDLNLMDGVTTVAYSHDLALVVEAEDTRGLMFKTNKALKLIAEWSETIKLFIAPEKTEAAVFKGSRKRANM